MVSRILARRISATKKSILLLGPRQVGKSTLCGGLRPDLSINLADEQEFLSYAKDPGLLKRRIAVLKRPGLILIDEIQRVPGLLNSVQVFADAAKPHRFLLTGSSSKKLRQRGVNLLPGRVILEHLDPLSVLELPGEFDLQRALQLGMLPGIFLGDEDSVDVLGTYAEVYLREEIRAEAWVKNVGSYARFLDLAALCSGQWLNYSKLSSEAEIPKETVRRYFDLLEDTLMIFRVPAFQPKRRISRRVAQKDKFVIFDVGVRNALLGLHSRPVSADQVGTVFEQWFTLQTYYLNRALKAGWKISSYRTEAGAEVDLVIERHEDIVGIEIKYSRNVGKSDLRGLSSLAETIGKYKPLKKWVVYLGEAPQVFAEVNVEVYPWRMALQQLADT